MVVRTAWFIMWLSPFLVATIIRASKHEPGRVDDPEYVPPLDQLVYPAQRHRDPHPDLVAIKSTLVRLRSSNGVLAEFAPYGACLTVTVIVSSGPCDGYLPITATSPVTKFLMLHFPSSATDMCRALFTTRSTHRQHPVLADGAK
ncbi:hypothetical protein BKA56DRAFT_687022 [Ilyonectria sp. MPI-CAGE-AT-0026]|nr:hypothetical protein BKA56DRAFT_687022 [Ilyonectria sp. MPI-CAGE-AT-0026]